MLSNACADAHPGGPPLGMEVPNRPVLSTECAPRPAYARRVRTDVAQVAAIMDYGADWLTALQATQLPRDPERQQLGAANAIGGQGAIPEAGEAQGVGGLALREVEFGHREC